LSPCVLIQKYLHVAGLDLGLCIEDLPSTSTFWPRWTSLEKIREEHKTRTVAMQTESRVCVAETTFEVY